MTTGLGVFIACLVLGVVLAALDCYRTWHRHGHGMAAGEAVVMALSLGVYAAVCLRMGYDLGAEMVAMAASTVPLILAGPFLVPSIREYLRGEH